MIERVADDKGNGTFKTRCDMCKNYTDEKNYILSVRLDGAIATDQDIQAVLCKKCYGKLQNMLLLIRGGIDND